MTNIVERKKLRIYKRDKASCQYCLRTLLYRDVTLDHMLPSSRGGSSDYDNLVVACRGCNGRKRTMLPLEFMFLEAGWQELKPLMIRRRLAIERTQIICLIGRLTHRIETLGNKIEKLTAESKE